VLQLRQLMEIWGAPQGLVDPAQLAQPLGPVCTDSRLLQAGAFFVPLVGDRFDGHSFLSQAAVCPAQAAVVNQDTRHPIPEGLLHWTVADTQDAYQQLACLHRRQLACPVVAVTGSAGKTTTRELIRAALAPLGAVQASIGNNNNDIGVPLTLLGLGPEHRAAVIEMGMRGPGEIARLSRCAEPQVAVITNIGTAHIGRLGSREAIAAAKCEITEALVADGLVVIPAGDPLLEQTLSSRWSGRVRRVALEGDPVLQAHPPDYLGRIDEAAGLLVCNGRRVQLPLEGRHNARNLLLALAVAEELGVDLQQLERLEVDMPGGRNRRLHLGGITVLDETYNASPEAVLAALDLLATSNGRRFAVLGTMLELGERSVELHRQVAERAVALGLDGLVLVVDGVEAEAMEPIALSLPAFARVSTPEDAMNPLRDWLRPGDTLLLKASRGVALERLLPLLDTLPTG
jgi:UDP-N-acetylmuramoyl-tripeptide--D-alanyl-D-alanine ligase